MANRNTHLFSYVSLVLGIVFFLFFHCTNMYYVGESYRPDQPIADVDVYFSEEAIEREYEVLGHALGSCEFIATYSRVQKKLIREAKLKGADAIVINGIDYNSYFPLTNICIAEKIITAIFIKYQ